VVHHSDRGVQYASGVYVAVLHKHGMIPSMSRPANPYDNASCESFMKTLKREEICANEYRDLDHLRANIAEFFDSYYNRVRLHSALGYKTPEFGVPIAVCLNRRGHPTKLSHNCAKTLLYWTTTEAKPFRSLLACRLIFPKPRASSATSSASTS
jgi:hypothetical protein